MWWESILYPHERAVLSEEDHDLEGSKIRGERLTYVAEIDQAIVALIWGAGATPFRGDCRRARLS